MELDTTEEQQAVEFYPGAVVSGHRIVRALGKGGFGQVYEAIDLTLSRHVAFKVLNHAPDANIARFRDEARLLAKLQHPNIVQIFQAGTLSDGRPFITMEFFGDGSLESQLENVRHDIPEVFAILAYVLQALIAAHGQGIVHRDIKEANILLDLETGISKICDFGIARALDPLENEAPPTGAAVIGTLHYMPPERYAGQNHDPRSDLYAVGVVLYRLLTGHRPFDDTKNRSVILKRLVTEDVAPPNEGPPALASFCARLLSRDPNDRPQTALEALEELEAIEEEYLSFLRAGEDLNEKPLKSESSAKLVIFLAFIFAVLVLIAVILALTLSSNQETPNLSQNDSPAVISVYIASEPDAEVWVDAEILPDAALQQEPDSALKIELEKSEQPKNKAQKITAPPKSPAPKTSKRSLSRTPNRTATQDPFVEPSH